MSVRISNSTPGDDEFGLIAWLEKTRIQLPLKAVDVRFEIVDTFAKVEIDSVFYNSRADALDVHYTFPLPTGASVYRCEMITEDNTITGVVEEEGVARENFKKAKREGRRAALVERHRENTFSLDLGNVQANEVVVLRLAYIQEVESAIRTSSLRIPLSPTDRFIPGKSLLRSNRGSGTIDDTDAVPDASLITPPRIDQLHPDAAQLRVCGKFPISMDIMDTLHSPSHSIATRSTDFHFVSLAIEADVPDRDFVVRWEAPQMKAGTSRLYYDPNEDPCYGLLTLMPPAAEEESVSTTPKRFWFLLDCSGSMGGGKWKQSCKALIKAVRELTAEDQVFITLFDDTYRFFAEKPLSPEALLKDQNFINLHNLFSGGGTELLPAVAETLGKRRAIPDAIREDHFVIITDGQVGNEYEIKFAFRRYAKDVCLHTIGIGFSPNESLLKPIAEAQGGQSFILTPDESVEEAVEFILQGSITSALKSLILPDSLKVIGKIPNRLSPKIVYRLPVIVKKPTETHILRGLHSKNDNWQAQPTLVQGDGELLKLHSISKLIMLFESGRYKHGVELATKHNILSYGTSFIAVDLENKVYIATQEFEQPVLAERRIDFLPMFDSPTVKQARIEAPPPFTDVIPELVNKCKSHTIDFEKVCEEIKTNVRSGGLYFSLLGRNDDLTTHWLAATESAIQAISTVKEHDPVAAQQLVEVYKCSGEPAWLAEQPNLRSEYEACLAEKVAYEELEKKFQDFNLMKKLLGELRIAILTHLPKATTPQTSSVD